jgi:hypothetical protein
MLLKIVGMPLYGAKHALMRVLIALGDERMGANCGGDEDRRISSNTHNLFCTGQRFQGASVR